MDLHCLVQRFSELDRARVGRGPRHLTQGNRSLEGALESFLKRYPFLKKDTGYVQFLECYAGAYLVWPEDELVIDIYGFSGVSTLIVGEDGPIIDEDGYLTFSSVLFRIREGPGLENIQTLGFAFDATQQRKPGIYRQVVGREEGSPIVTDWYGETFLEWFKDVMDKKGRLIETR